MIGPGRRGTSSVAKAQQSVICGPGGLSRRVSPRLQPWGSGTNFQVQFRDGAWLGFKLGLLRLQNGRDP